MIEPRRSGGSEAGPAPARVARLARGLAGGLRRHWRRGARGAAVVGLLLAGVAWLAAWQVPLPDRLVTTGSPVLRYADGFPAHVELSPDDKWRITADLDRIDPDFVTALVALEDERFWIHPGVDPIAVARATGQNLAAGQVVSGASTLTMQLARLLEPRPRTLSSKAIEAVRAAQIELRMSKREVLAAYLTLTPYGRNVEGIEAAAWAYFGHGAGDLDPAEIATLLAVPQNPTARHPAPDHTDRLRAARDGIARRLLAEGALPTGARPADEVLAEIHAAPVPDRLRPVPREIPHVAAWLEDRPLDQPTTLDRGVQALAQRTLAAHRPEAERRGIHNGAVVVVEHATGRIRALVGSFDFWDGTHGGQIPAFAIPRSPGSTLKPLIYARAIDRGLLLPEQLRPDIPVQYGQYAPENYDGGYAGVVRMEDALSRSLNVPFVNLLGEVGVEPFLGDLRALGATHLDPTPGHYGLSIAAGGIELTPIELAAAYVSLSRGGTSRELTVRPDPAPGERRLYTEGATWLTRRALRLRDRPDFPSRRQLSSAPRRIHWKTGTSFGHRDAWAVGSGERYTVVVWLGNVDQTASVHLVGSEAAGPVLFDLLEGLDDGADGSAAPPPADLIEIEVCALSGFLPGPACPHTADAQALEHRVPTETCPYHRRYEVDVATGLAVTPLCRGDRVTEERAYVLWPSAVRRWLDDQRRLQPHPPAYAPGCEPAGEGDPPQILSPAPGQVVMLLPGVAEGSQQIPLEASSRRADADLSWFVDGEWLGTVPADERLWWTPSPGRHRVVAMDPSGLASAVTVQVRGGRQLQARR